MYNHGGMEKGGHEMKKQKQKECRYQGFRIIFYERNSFIESCKDKKKRKDFNEKDK